MKVSKQIVLQVKYGNKRFILLSLIIYIMLFQPFLFCLFFISFFYTFKYNTQTYIQVLSSFIFTATFVFFLGTLIKNIVKQPENNEITGNTNYIFRALVAIASLGVFIASCLFFSVFYKLNYFSTQYGESMDLGKTHMDDIFTFKVLLVISTIVIYILYTLLQNPFKNNGYIASILNYVSVVRPKYLITSFFMVCVLIYLYFVGALQNQPISALFIILAVFVPLFIINVFNLENTINIRYNAIFTLIIYLVSIIGIMYFSISAVDSNEKTAYLVIPFVGWAVFAFYNIYIMDRGKIHYLLQFKRYVDNNNLFRVLTILLVCLSTFLIYRGVMLNKELNLLAKT